MKNNSLINAIRANKFISTVLSLNVVLYIFCFNLYAENAKIKSTLAETRILLEQQNLNSESIQKLEATIESVDGKVEDLGACIAASTGIYTGYLAFGPAESYCFRSLISTP